MKYFYPYTIVCLKEDELKEKACFQIISINRERLMAYQVKLILVVCFLMNKVKAI